MRPASRWPLGFAALLALGLIAAGPTPELPKPLPFYDPAQLRPGMVGTGRTVFQGVTPEEFQVEILGVLENAIGPQQDMIVARLHGANVERTGVIAGMSGSPVILDGKILGAVSYRLGTFEKEAIAGITPIRDMLRAAEMPARAARTTASAILQEWSAPSPASPGQAAAGIPLPGEASRMVPIATPLVFAGYPEELIRQVTPLFAARGLEPTAGGGGSSSPGREYAIEPGTAISVPLVRGDLSIAATGTLTHVEGNRVWGFGHPFLGLGAVRYPMARAEVVITYPSLLGSFKISNSTSLIGTLQQDRLTCIEGSLGAAPEMLPIEVAVDFPTGPRKLSFEVVHDDVLTPLLVGLSVQASLQRVLEYSAEATLQARLEVVSEGHPTLKHEMVESDLGGPQASASASIAREIATLFSLVYGNRFEEVQVKSARLSVAAVPEAKLAKIGELSVTPAVVRPGEEVSVRATLEPFRGPAILRVFKVSVPPETPRGPLSIVVSSARNLNGMEGAVLQQRFTGTPGVDEMIRFFNSLRRDDALYLQMTRRGQGAVVEGETLPALPLSVLYTLGSARHSGEEYAAPELPVLEMMQSTEFVLTGGRRTVIQVR